MTHQNPGAAQPFGPRGQNMRLGVGGFEQVPHIFEDPGADYQNQQAPNRTAHVEDQQSQGGGGQAPGGSAGAIPRCRGTSATGT